ncbi:hypothetical protein F4808DRAFT_456640 [Astrocystis sublimbata]|nr:hypothetical protein F4808DRAFT_456640 [Astrocystis sublimbata]
MCRYRKSMYSCNHSIVSAEPFTLCPIQKDYISGKSAEPCDMVQTHLCSTIRISKPCESCGKARDTLNTRLSDAKKKMAELRQRLGLSEATSSSNQSEGDGDDKKSEGEGSDKEKEKELEKEKEVDPVHAFLERKKTEKHAHLMMLGGK